MFASAETARETMPPFETRSTVPERTRAKDARAAVAGLIRDIHARLLQCIVRSPEFEVELLAMFVRNELSARVTVPLLTVIFSLASMFWAPVLQASAWLALVI